MIEDRAFIPGSLVGMKNIGVHKSVALTVHVPEELALRVIEVFGWPTGANPVSVIVARLATQEEKHEEVSFNIYNSPNP